jgi:hypothetical protein
VQIQLFLNLFPILDGARGSAEQLREAISAIPGIVDLRIEKQVRVPQLDLRIDYDRAGSYGITPAAVSDAIATLSNGKIVSRVIDGLKRYDVVQRLPDETRTTSALADLLIETPKGPVPLRNLAEVVETDGPNQILREAALTIGGLSLVSCGRTRQGNPPSGRGHNLWRSAVGDIARCPDHSNPVSPVWPRTTRTHHLRSPSIGQFTGLLTSNKKDISQ